MSQRLLNSQSLSMESGDAWDVEEFLLCTLSVAFRVRINGLNAPLCRSKGSVRKTSDSHGLLPSRKPSSLLSLLWHCYFSCSYMHASALKKNDLSLAGIALMANITQTG